VDHRLRLPEAVLRREEKMSERKLSTFTEVDNSVRFYRYPVDGFSLKFVSGPEMTKNVQPGHWLIKWEMRNGNRIFGFGPERDVIFVSREAAKEAQDELKNAVEVVTEVVG
jgi:hypothetical protein